MILILFTLLRPFRAHFEQLFLAHNKAVETLVPEWQSKTLLESQPLDATTLESLRQVDFFGKILLMSVSKLCLYVL